KTISTRFDEGPLLTKVVGIALALEAQSIASNNGRPLRDWERVGRRCMLLVPERRKVCETSENSQRIAPREATLQARLKMPAAGAEREKHFTEERLALGLVTGGRRDSAAESTTPAKQTHRSCYGEAHHSCPCGSSQILAGMRLPLLTRRHS